MVRPLLSLVDVGGDLLSLTIGDGPKRLLPRAEALYLVAEFLDMQGLEDVKGGEEHKQ